MITRRAGDGEQERRRDSQHSAKCATKLVSANARGVGIICQLTDLLAFLLLATYDAFSNTSGSAPGSNGVRDRRHIQARMSPSLPYLTIPFLASRNPRLSEPTLSYP